MAEQINTIVMTPFSGSILVGDLNEAEATDVEQKVTVECPNVSHVENLLIDLVTDKGGTLRIIRYLGSEKTRVGLAPDEQTINAGGGSFAFMVPTIGCLSAEVIFAKTESGDTNGLTISVRGEG